MTDPIETLSRALDQAEELLSSVQADDLDKPTPCTDWSVRDLASHLASGPGNFLKTARGEEVDFTAPADILDGAWATTFRAGADGLLQHWKGQSADQAAGAGFQVAEMAVHSWDLASALGRGAALDDEVAEVGLAAMQQGLTDENRGSVFAAAVPVGEDASAYDRLAAFAGRTP